MNSQATIPPLYGLVLVGGRSSRMHRDKALLDYHGRSQMEFCVDLLKPYCEKIFLSCRNDQSGAAEFSRFAQVHDTFLDMGPMGGILSAFRAHPGKAFLVLACDLPMLDAITIKTLASLRNPIQIATAFTGSQIAKPDFKNIELKLGSRKTDSTITGKNLNPHSDDYRFLPEPLCAIYEPAAYPAMLEFLGRGITCPRKVLIQSDVEILNPPSREALANANDPEAYLEYQKALGKKDSV